MITRVEYEGTIEVSAIAPLTSIYFGVPQTYPATKKAKVTDRAALHLPLPVLIQQHHPPRIGQVQINALPPFRVALKDDFRLLRQDRYK